MSSAMVAWIARRRLVFKELLILLLVVKTGLTRTSPFFDLTVKESSIFSDPFRDNLLICELTTSYLMSCVCAWSALTSLILKVNRKCCFRGSFIMVIALTAVFLPTSVPGSKLGVSPSSMFLNELGAMMRYHRFFLMTAMLMFRPKTIYKGFSMTASSIPLRDRLSWAFLSSSPSCSSGMVASQIAPLIVQVVP